jgi:hypothetical protein
MITVDMIRVMLRVNNLEIISSVLDKIKEQYMNAIKDRNVLKGKSMLVI